MSAKKFSMHLRQHAESMMSWVKDTQIEVTVNSGCSAGQIAVDRQPPCAGTPATENPGLRQGKEANKAEDKGDQADQELLCSRISKR